MTVSPLQDLSNRIASNTLTGPQQAALTTALAAIIPSFQGPDEIGDSIPTTEEVLARDWIAALYTINGEATGVLPTTVTAWFINPSTGSDTNDGLSPSTALKTFAALGALWRGTAGGGRPVLNPSTGSTITVTLLATAPQSDPMAPILDVDITLGNSLIIVGTNLTPTHVGTLATVSAFARTSAAGKIGITDGAVANYHPFVGTASLLIDNTANAVTWLYAPDPGASATGNVWPAHNPLTPGVPFAPPTVTISAGDNYQLQPLVGAALGEGFVTRSFPEIGTGSNATASVWIYRLELITQGTNPIATLQSQTVFYGFQECQYDVPLSVTTGTIELINCFGFHSNVGTNGDSVAEILGGGLSGQVNGGVVASGTSVIIADLDFGIFGGGTYTANVGATIHMGDVSRWNAGGNEAFDVFGGTITQGPAFAGTAVAYGTDAGGAFAKIPTGFGQLLYFNDGGGTPAQDAFQFTSSAFTMGQLGGSAFAMSNTTGLAVGPTTDTLAHLDAAIGAGTGFGGAAIDPRSMCTFRIAA